MVHMHVNHITEYINFVEWDVVLFSSTVVDPDFGLALLSSFFSLFNASVNFTIDLRDKILSCRRS